MPLVHPFIPPSIYLSDHLPFQLAPQKPVYPVIQPASHPSFHPLPKVLILTDGKSQKANDLHSNLETLELTLCQPHPLATNSLYRGHWLFICLLRASAQWALIYLFTTLDTRPQACLAKSLWANWRHQDELSRTLRCKSGGAFSQETMPLSSWGICLQIFG